MSTLVLKTAGSVVGGALFGPLGAAIGGALGAVGGAYVDQKLFGSSRSVVGSSLSDLTVQTSTEGASIPRLYGRARLTGQILWATNLVEEVTSRKRQTGASKGGMGATTTETTYSYSANFAVGLCEGEIAYIGRIWANGTVLDLDDITYRVYRGTDDQLPDSLIEAKQGAGKAPSYRGLAYVVFEELPLEDFGNRIPQLSFEVVRLIGALETQVRSVVMIPGATEFGYDTTEVSRKDAEGEWSSENRHSYEPGTDFEVSLDHLIALCPNLVRVALVVSWFGSDLRAGKCAIQPKIDDKTKVTDTSQWSVAGLSRSEVERVSLTDGRPAYGGTPSDESVLHAIAAIRERGLEVTLYPFIMMDIPADNGLADPYGAGEQAAFPWRGRITCYPGPDQDGSVDNTAAAAEQVTQFYDLQEWNYRRFVMHYAQLAANAGGVDGFLIGSELRGLTQLRDAEDGYPFVARLKELASDVRNILGASTKLTYAADWSEYFGHHLQDGSGTVRFHLDPLWADDNIDAVGIDNYMPLSDWRVGESHLDASVSDTGLEAAYLQGNVAGGEGFDWYYASGTDREKQIRTPITDRAEGKDWVFRYKDLVSWWSNPHFDRPDGAESASATSWVPCSKPIWFTEIGCPAVHMGPNQPNVFSDAKSSESALPYFSTGARSDAAQRSMLTASLDYWQGDGVDRNPVSSLYGGSMVDTDQMYLWAWDARPFPAFPLSRATWADGDAWYTGHWLNGRLGNAPLQDIIKTVMEDYGLDAPDLNAITAVVDGFVIERRMSLRSALENLCDAFNISFITSGDRLRFEKRDRRISAAIDENLLVDVEEEPLVSKRIDPWENESSSVTFSFNELFQDYRQSVARYDQPSARTKLESAQSLAVISTEPVMVDAARNWLRQSNYARHTASFKLPMSKLDLEAGDLVSIESQGYQQVYRIDDIEDGDAREISASLMAPRNAVPYAQNIRATSHSTPSVVLPVCVVLDLPLLPGKTGYPHAPYLASYCSPWPGGLGLYEGSSDIGFSYRQTLRVSAVIGTLQTDLAGQECFSWDHASVVEVKLSGGDLASVDQSSLFAGTNAAAIETSEGTWEILQFADAELIGPSLWRLKTLLRGQLGTEAAALKGAGAGARFVLLDEAVMPVEIDAAQLAKTLPFRIVPTGGALSDPRNIDLNIGIVGRGLVPLSPVHLRVLRSEADGTLTFSWIRRDRLDADSWVDSIIPLSEELEVYSVSIRHPDTGETLRTTELNAPVWQYSASAQVEDGVEDLTDIVLDIAQVSRRTGAGDRLLRRVNPSTLSIRA